MHVHIILLNLESRPHAVNRNTIKALRLLIPAAELVVVVGISVGHADGRVIPSIDNKSLLAQLSILKGTTHTWAVFRCLSRQRNGCQSKNSSCGLQQVHLDTGLSVIMEVILLKALLNVL